MVSIQSGRMAVPELRSKRLRLRALTARDRDAWFDLRQANAAWLKPWDPTNPLGLRETLSYRQMLRRQRQGAMEGSGFSWVLTLPALNERRPPLIGQVSVSGVQYGAARNASIGYWIDSSHAGFGLMPEACALVVEHCFTTLRLHRLEINVRPENTASLRVAAKLGFRDEGVRKDFLHINGRWRDHRTFALTADEHRGQLLEHIS
ncbi:GNAT family N-acetyltransferase [Glutamicibacter endophyticus]|uniref:GNAT family N-acetyltransferase n=1 Tax=Glutamicibacter endophyticus TaxID=1522174 RepID=UPI003AF0A1A9